MPKISYGLKVPNDKYLSLKEEIENIARDNGYKDGGGVEFDDKSRIITFNHDYTDIWILFKNKIENKEEYPFFCKGPFEHDPAIYTRYKDGAEESYEAAYNAIDDKYKALESRLLLAKQEGQSSEKQNIVIGEVHADLSPKIKIIEILEDQKTIGKQRMLVLERLSASHNEALQAWLEDGLVDSKLPPELAAEVEICDFYTAQAAKEYVDPPHTDDLPEGYLDKIGSGMKDILFAAKKTGSEVMLLESELTSGANRHQHLVVALDEITTANSGKEIVVLTGGYHEMKSPEQPIILSDGLNGSVE
jgi:hypothetical protein